MTGVITKTDIVRQVAGGELLRDVTIEDVMTATVTYCNPGDWLHDVLALMHLEKALSISLSLMRSISLAVL